MNLWNLNILYWSVSLSGLCPRAQHSYDRTKQQTELSLALERDTVSPGHSLHSLEKKSPETRESVSLMIK